MSANDNSGQPLKEYGRFLLEFHRSKILLCAEQFDDNTGGAALIEAANPIEAKNTIERDPAVRSRVMTDEIRLWNFVAWEKYVKR